MRRHTRSGEKSREQCRGMVVGSVGVGELQKIGDKRTMERCTYLHTHTRMHNSVLSLTKGSTNLVGGVTTFVAGNLPPLMGDWRRSLTFFCVCAVEDCELTDCEVGCDLTDTDMDIRLFLVFLLSVLVCSGSN